MTSFMGSSIVGKHGGKLYRVVATRPIRAWDALG